MNVKTHRFKAIHLTTASAKAGISVDPRHVPASVVLAICCSSPSGFASAFAFPNLASAERDQCLLALPNCLLRIVFGCSWLRFVKSVSPYGQLFDRPNLPAAAPSDGFGRRINVWPLIHAYGVLRSTYSNVRLASRKSLSRIVIVDKTRGSA